ncbi:DUF2680 domain-containing protein [Spongisporangium articulatum]|uniref:DUF2680 domain-containing protein n=1 Tax=Spongisporangium articulatum TaxID=3362603 RepID=A0ABW8ANJ2_9ACTN
MTRNRLIAVVAAVGLAALGVGAAVAIPAMADDSKPAPSAAPNAQQFQQERQKRVREQLQSLVDDKTITAEQADKVAAKLAQQGGPGRGPGMGPGMGFGPGRDLMGYGKPVLDAAAKSLGMSTDDLVSALRGGSTLKQLADQQGKDLPAVETAITSAVRTQVAQAVKDGKLTQDQADRITENLDQRVKDFAENGRGGFGLHGGMGGGMSGRMGGPGMMGRPGEGGPTPTSTT